MYLQHFGLTSYPFSIAPDADVIYYNEQYRDAYAHLHYSIQHPGGIIILTGEVGTGKTTLVRSFLQRQDSNHVRTAYVFNPKQSATSLLESICQEFGIETARNRNSSNKLIDQLYEFLIATYKRKQRALIVIDEAQHLDFDALEYLRLVTNLETGISKLVQIILVGQEELLLKLTQPELRQFKQRIVARFHLRCLSEQQLFDYVQHRLSIVNGSSDIIPQSLRRLLYEYTRGVPRVANTLCDRALLGAYAKNRSQVDKATLKKAAEELFIEPAVTPPAPDVNTLVADRQNTQGLPVGNSDSLNVQTPESRQSVQHKLTSQLRSLYKNLMAIDPAMLRRSFSFLLSPAFLRTLAVLTAVMAGSWLMRTSDTQEQIVSDTRQVEEAMTPDSLYVLDNLNDLPRATSDYGDYSSLLELWGIDYDFRLHEDPCTHIQRYQLTCALIKVEDTELIRRINLPTVIEWQGEGGNQTALLVGFDDRSAILQRNTTYYKIDNDQLAASWQGYGHYFVRAPKDFRTAFKPDSESDSVIWLINALTEIDQKYSLNQVSETYNDQVIRTVRTFQKQHGLTADGIADFETLALLNHLLYRAPQLEYIK